MVAVTRPAEQLQSGSVAEKPLARLPLPVVVTVGTIRVQVAVPPHLTREDEGRRGKEARGTRGEGK